VTSFSRQITVISSMTKTGSSNNNVRVSFDTW